MWVYGLSGWVNIDLADTDLIQIENFKQRLLTQRGEQNFNSTNGIDWYNVMAGSVDVRVEINTIAEDFSDYFLTEVTDVYLEDPTKLMIQINLTLKNGLSAVTLSIKNGQYGLYFSNDRR